VDTPALLAHWPTKDPQRPTRRELESLSDFLATRGVGIEPDVTFGGPSLARGPRAALFRLPGGARETPSDAYGGAAVLLQLAATVAAADGEVSPAEQRHLSDHLQAALHLDGPQRIRLEARFCCLAADPPPLGRAKKSIEQIDVEQRHALGAFLIALAGADGHLAPEELKVLSKIYPRLGLQPEAVYADVHQLVSAQVAAAEAPVSVRAAELPAGFAIPRPEPEPGRPAGVVALDLVKVRAKLAETERVSQLLGEIFVEEAVEAPAAPPPAASAKDDALIRGLDGAHSALLLTLAGAASWQRTRLERLADRLGLLPDGALEVINEAAFAACGAPLLEGEDPIELDREVLQEMLA
ncbi:MAG TPA: tellurite resistance TerB C-terminal domain-containing protein, partial [Thermoanaerobaculia bacterium]|nr:tellurite resistance TerB C-terminal domain-containing protein [Thermoanaerobaculia bacterium]